MNKIWIIVLIGMITFAVIIGTQMFVDKHERIPFSKESCESFNGAWIEEEQTCYAIGPEDCWNMRGRYETIENFLLGSTEKCVLYD